MRKFTRLVMAFVVPAFATCGLKAQITITQSDMPQAGSLIAVDSDLAPTVTPGSSGASRTWNYTTLHSTKTSTNSFVNASATPYAASFPGANLADSVWGFPGYNYFSSQSGSFSITGGMPIISGYQVTVNFTPPYEQLALPATYNSALGGMSRGVTKAVGFHYLSYDSAKGTLDITYADTIDAWGTMQLASGTYNVLRQKRREIDIDSVFLHNSFTHSWSFYQASKTKTNTYVWYTNGLHYSLVQMQMDTANVTVKSVAWYTPPSGVNELANNARTLVYPNPCSTQVTFSYNGLAEGYVTLFDINGRQIAESVIKNGTSQFNTSSFPKGIYLFRVTTPAGMVLDYGKLAVQ